jgi:hypothetical protein
MRKQTTTAWCQSADEGVHNTAMVLFVSIQLPRICQGVSAPSTASTLPLRVPWSDDGADCTILPVYTEHV